MTNNIKKRQSLFCVPYPQRWKILLDHPERPVWIYIHAERNDEIRHRDRLRFLSILREAKT